MPVKRASKVYGVPVQTLRDRVLGKVEPECETTGRKPVLSMYDEAKIVEHIRTMSGYGYGYTLQEVADIASEYAVLLGLRTSDNPLTLRWMEGFRKRWPEVKVSKPRSLEHVRAKMTSEVIVNSYFQNLEKAMLKQNVLDKPHRIFNVDEKGISLDHKPPHIVSCSDGPLAVTTGKSKTITILGCGSAGGVAIPPYFIFPGKRMIPELLAGSSPGTDGTVTESGWSNSSVFRDYLQHHFLKYVPGGTEEPILLLLDGHKSHVSVDLVEWAKQHNIFIFVLPAHTSHLLQPLDVAVYGPFQKIYNTLCHKFIRSTSSTICRYNVCELACKAYSKALSTDNLLSAFRKTGIYPLDKDAIDKTKLIPAEVFEEKKIDEYPEDQDSQQTVEGRVLEPEACLKRRVDKLKSVKQVQPVKKTRKTISKIVSGKDLTDDDVFRQMKEHEKSQKQPKSSSKPTPVMNVPNNEPQPGPSHIRIDENCDAVSEIDEEDEEPCCVCEMREPPREKMRRGTIELLNWAQCDGINNRKACLHWVHLKFCSDVQTVGHGDKFYCPHCI